MKFGLRYWYSTSKTQVNLYSVSNTQASVSRLTFGGLDTYSAESFARLDHKSGFFVKGFLGRGAVNNGTLIDEDFPPFITSYSATAQRVTDSTLAYGSIDVGHTVRGRGVRLGAFAGYHYQREKLNAFGCSQIAANSIVCSGNSALSPAILPITQDNKWQAARIGVEVQIALSDRLTLGGEAAWLPYVWLEGNDFHWLRIGSGLNTFNGPIPENGSNGKGVQLEMIIGYNVSSNSSVGAGLRYWRIEMPNALAHFEVASNPVGFYNPQPERWLTERYGAFLQASYKL